MSSPPPKPYILGLSQELLDEVIRFVIDDETHQYVGLDLSLNDSAGAMRQYVKNDPDLDVETLQTKWPYLKVTGTFLEKMSLLFVSRHVRYATRKIMKHFGFAVSAPYSYIGTDDDLLAPLKPDWYWNREAYGQPEQDEDDEYYESWLLFWPTQELERFFQYILSKLQLAEQISKIYPPETTQDKKMDIEKIFLGELNTFELHYDVEMLYEVAKWMFNFADDDDKLDLTSPTANYTERHFPKEMENVSRLASVQKEAIAERAAIPDLGATAGEKHEFKVVISRVQRWYGDSSHNLDYVPINRKHRDGTPDSVGSYDRHLKHEHLMGHVLFLIEEAVTTGKLDSTVKVVVDFGKGDANPTILPHPKMDDLLVEVRNGNFKGCSRRLIEHSMRHTIRSEWMDAILTLLKPGLEEKEERFDRYTDFVVCDSGCRIVDPEWRSSVAN